MNVSEGVSEEEAEEDGSRYSEEEEEEGEEWVGILTAHDEESDQAVDEANSLVEDASQSAALELTAAGKSRLFHPMPKSILSLFSHSLHTATPAEG